MFSRVKTLVRDLLPRRFQVPVKYWYSRARGGYEPEMQWLRDLVRSGDRVIDVGGNRGLYTYELAGLGARVEVFEPNPACSAVLAAWAVTHPAITVHPVALSNREGRASLHIPVDASGVEHDSSASLEHADAEGVRNQDVPLKTLDGYGFTDVQFVKIDVEGHELDVLEGAVGMLAASRPALLIEIEQRHAPRPIAETFTRLEGLGYRGYFLEGGRLVGLERFDVAVHQDLARFEAQSGYVNNFLFLHEDRLRLGQYARLLGR